MASGFKKLKKSLSKTRDSILGKIGGLIGSRKIDDNLLDEIEEILLKADIGVSATEKTIENLRLQAKDEKASGADDIFRLLRKQLSDILLKNKKEILPSNQNGTAVWLITGVNGTGKTTTVGKLAYFLKSQGKSVMIAACDTFRAAA